MALMTPRGLKIRLGLDWAFTLMGRLWQEDPRTDAFRVLKTCEAIECVPSALSFICGAVAAFATTWPTWSILAAIVGGRILGVLLTQLGLFIVLRPTGLLLLSAAWSYVSGFGLFQAAAIVTLFILRDWQAAAFWIAGLLTAFVAQQILEWWSIGRYHRLVGEAFTPAEVNFFNAYRLHADRLRLPRAITVTDEELDSGYWRECLWDYAIKWPEAVARFPSTAQVADALSSIDDPLPKIPEQMYRQLINGKQMTLFDDIGPEDDERD